ncbi:MAG: hypothetical protein OHK003_02880 [Anaerolineales bacterium]
MNKSGRSQLALGIILILIGGWFLLNQTMPEFREFFEPYTKWPSNMLLIGAAILVIGLATGSPSLAVPAAIVAGIGGIFYYQEATGDYGSWSFMWTLIPGFIGVGTILQGLLGENTAHNLKRGLNLMVVSAVLFLVFAAFLGGWNILGNYGPAVLLILLGLWVLGSGLYRTYRKKGE